LQAPVICGTARKKEGRSTYYSAAQKGRPPTEFGGVAGGQPALKGHHARSICDETGIIPVLHNVELSQAHQAQLATSQKFHLAREMFEKSAVFSLARLAPA